MNARTFSNAMDELDEKYIMEALRCQKKAKKPGWVRWGVLAACLSMVATLGAWLLTGKPETIALSSGESLVFTKAESITRANLDMDATVRTLTEDELQAVFPGLPVTGHALFTTGDHQLLGVEGNIGNLKMVISATEQSILDTVIAGREACAEVGGIGVRAGYFLTDRNSKWERNVIYYATFQLGGSTIYLENAGPEAHREAVKAELAAVLETMIGWGGLNLDAIQG